jgi:hypothetical protein
MQILYKLRAVVAALPYYFPYPIDNTGIKRARLNQKQKLVDHQCFSGVLATHLGPDPRRPLLQQTAMAVP